ncbi:unnamed protein product [Mytilus coruscus]|uniref:DNA-directed DNA polymerase n=1 Tax=Mytilus coruscus TaxID=42192 RepID=A0A6J8ECK5_MYTCO|nr:unnamed protein product [Mytilus coruscus]
MKELYDQTKERLKTIEDYLKPNVKIHTIWECEFNQQKYPEVDPHLKPIDKRDAFYGGRTETIQLYNNLSDLKDTFMKYKQEASGCKCDPKYCKPDCENDKECKTKIQYIIDNAAYNLDIDKVKHNSGLRFIAKICLNNLWGHFAYTEKDDPYARVILGKIKLSNYQICCLRDDGECPLTSKQMEVMEKFKGKKLSKFPPGWDAFIRPDKIYEYVFEKPCPEI